MSPPSQAALPPPNTSALQVVTEQQLWVPSSYSKPHWLSILSMVIQCYSLKSSHPLLLPLCPKVCSLCLYFLCCPAHKIINSIFLDSIYMHSDQISRSVVSDSLQPHESQHARPPCPSPTPRVHSDSRPSSQ